MHSLRGRHAAILPFVIAGAIGLSACEQVPGETTLSEASSTLSDEFKPPDRGAVALLYETQRSYYTGAERMQVLAVCLEDQGFSVSVRGNAMMSHTPDAQRSAFESAHLLCSNQVDARFPEIPAPTAEVEYEFNLALADCLRSEGYDIPAAPTFETWRDSIGESDSWHPYAYISVQNLPQTEWDRLNALCPQYGMDYRGCSHQGTSCTGK